MHNYIAKPWYIAMLPSIKHMYWHCYQPAIEEGERTPLSSNAFTLHACLHLRTQHPMHINLQMAAWVHHHVFVDAWKRSRSLLMMQTLHTSLMMHARLKDSNNIYMTCSNSLWLQACSLTLSFHNILSMYTHEMDFNFQPDWCSTGRSASS